MAVLLTLVAAPLRAQTSTPAADALKRLQQQQARDSAVRQKDIGERLRQQREAQQRRAVTDPQLQRQLKAGDAAQHQRYRSSRDDLIHQYPGMPRPSEQPVPAPAATADAPASAASSGGPR